MSSHIGVALYGVLGEHLEAIESKSIMRKNICGHTGHVLKTDDDDNDNDGDEYLLLPIPGDRISAGLRHVGWLICQI